MTPVSLGRASALAVQAALGKGLTARPNKMLQLTRPSLGAAWRISVWRRTVALKSMPGQRWAAQLSIDPLGSGKRELRCFQVAAYVVQYGMRSQGSWAQLGTATVSRAEKLMQPHSLQPLASLAPTSVG